MSAGEVPAHETKPCIFNHSMSLLRDAIVSRMCHCVLTFKLLTASCSCCACPGSKAFAASLGPRPVDTTTSPTTFLLEHWGMSQHVRKNEVANLRSTEVDLFQVGDLSITAGDSYSFQHGIHVVL